jgi:ABC-type uncharacterized transport system involved in gliding motility auxiliary subunit
LDPFDFEDLLALAKRRSEPSLESAAATAATMARIENFIGTREREENYNGDMEEEETITLQQEEKERESLIV